MTAQDVIALVAGVLGIVLAVLRIIEAIPKAKLPGTIGALFQKAAVAWWSLAVVLVGTGAYLMLSSRDLLLRLRAMPIEKAGVMYGSYEGKGGSSYLTTTSTSTGRTATTHFRLESTLPGKGEAYAGVWIEFTEPLDISRYDAIELKTSFGDEDARWQVCIDDRFGASGCAMLGDGSIVAAKQEQQVVRVPLQPYFENVARKFVHMIKIDVNDAFAQGAHTITVSNIRFTR